MLAWRNPGYSKELLLLGFSDFTIGRYIETTVTNEAELLIAPVEPFSSRKPKITSVPQQRTTTVVAPIFKRYCELGGRGIMLVLSCCIQYCCICFVMLTNAKRGICEYLYVYVVNILISDFTDTFLVVYCLIFFVVSSYRSFLLYNVIFKFWISLLCNCPTSNNCYCRFFFLIIF